MKRKHAQPNVESMIEYPKIHQFTENGLILRHPFTMMVAASTGGGKTWLVKNLLENRRQWISPAAQRIIWIYGQWQPLYAEMQIIIPGIEFVKGIPANIEDEQFLNPAIRNLIVIDDLMTEASNDKRICGLFTKGLHHCNLSVIYLHRSIVRDIKAEMDELYDPTKAIRNVLRKRKFEVTDFVDLGEESSREESDNEGTADNIL